ncbi:AMP-binding protein [Micrococcus sp. M4NT]|uniref:class I adenylate-forming enzyme family protein n=1 Tax=Micrococcus sp. M4NT TaxID=2957501 RepID=UPI0029B509C4|nr:AMP-binding protein [Micrococcus sp. M4NT]MDX2340155.1 AMP-binding protein [Micrococcus sp. M4NT]
MPTLPGVLASTARRVPDRPALRWGESSLTYGELDRTVTRLAAELADRGVQRGDRVVLVAGNTMAFVVGIYGALRAGAIAVPVNPRSAAPELRHFLADTESSMVLVDPAAGDGVRALQADDGGLGTATALGLGELDGFDDVLAAALARDESTFERELSEDDDALIIYTSGTTGRPKGALFDHHRVLWVGQSITMGLGLRLDETMLHVAPLYHSASLNLLLFNGVMLGATQVLMPAFAPDDVLEALEREKVTVFFGVPTMFASMLRSPQMAARDLSHLRHLFYGAAPMPASTAEALVAALPHVDIVQACGQTEGGPGGILLTHEEVMAHPSASGRLAMPNTEVRVVDADGEDVAVGEVGEMIMRGETMMKGYWRNPEATAATVVDGWVHTGDLTRVDEGGYLTIVDRLKDLIITGGRNVYSVEVENALAGCPGVAELAIVGRDHPDFGESIVAVVTPAPGATVTLEDLRAYGESRIARFKLPHDLVIAEIPRNLSGKILKHRLRAQLDGPVGSADPAAQA